MGADLLKADLAIVGGGPTGASLALLAAGLGFETALVDARPTAPAKRRDPRNYAVVRGSWRLLQAAGVADAVEPDAQPLHGLEAVDGASHWFGAPSVLFGDADLEGEGTLGWMVEAAVLQAALDEEVERRSGLTVLRPVRFAGLETVGGAARLALEDGRTVEAALVAGCDGVDSPVRAALGAPTEGRAYGKSVFAADVALSRPHHGIARQLFTPEGPFATLPLTGDRANLAWYMQTGAARALAALPTESVEAELNARFAAFAGEMRLIGPALSYPLELKIATRMVGPRAALVGDAARRINPLAGQGLNLGFKDVGALVEVIADARRVGTDIGSDAALERYEQWRRFDATATALAMDAVDRVFSNDNALLKPLRGLALAAADRIAPVRRALARQASADRTDLPKLLRGAPLA